MTKKKYCGTVKVGTDTLRVVKVKELYDDTGKVVFGQIHHFDDRIELNSSRSHYKMYKTFLHELIHAIGVERCLDMDEVVVDSLTNGLVALFHDNPWMVAMILEERFFKNNEKNLDKNIGNGV